MKIKKKTLALVMALMVGVTCSGLLYAVNANAAQRTDLAKQ